MRSLASHIHHNGLHVLELFGGIGLGVLRTALAAGYSIRCYTYVDRDNVSRRIARAVLDSLERQYPLQLLASATRSFDKRLPQSIFAICQLFLANLVAHNGPVDLLGGSWECQSVSRAGHRMGAMDPRFAYFYDMIRIMNFFQREQTTPFIYILENTYPEENCTPAVAKAGDLVEAFLGAPVLVDGANLGAAAHRVRLLWTNVLPAATLQAALPTLLTPSPSLDTILRPYHVPTKLGHTDRLPFALHNQMGWERICMPTVVSYLRSNAFRAKDNGTPGEGEVYNIHTNTWEEPDTWEKEQLLGFLPGDTCASGVTRAIEKMEISEPFGLGAPWMPTPCVGWVHSCTLAKHRDQTPPRLQQHLFHLGRGDPYILLSLPSTMFQPSEKWSQLTPPSSLHLLSSCVQLPAASWLLSLPRNPREGLLKTLGFWPLRVRGGV